MHSHKFLTLVDVFRLNFLKRINTLSTSAIVSVCPFLSCRSVISSFVGFVVVLEFRLFLFCFFVVATIELNYRANSIWRNGCLQKLYITRFDTCMPPDFLLELHTFQRVNVQIETKNYIGKGNGNDLLRLPVSAFCTCVLCRESVMLQYFFFRLLCFVYATTPYFFS